LSQRSSADRCGPSGRPALATWLGRMVADEYLGADEARAWSAIAGYTVPCRMRGVKEKRERTWDAGRVRALRRHLGLSQDGLAGELGTRQQTVSEWETGQYEPRGASVKLLGIIAERAGFEYEAVSRVEEGEGDEAR